MEDNKKGIIIEHSTGIGTTAFDILIHKDNIEKESIDGYNMDCRYVKQFLKENPDYIYLYSEDNGHIPEFNWIENYVIELIEKGWKVVSLDTSKENK